MVHSRGWTWITVGLAFLVFHGEYGMLLAMAPFLFRERWSV